MIKSLSFVLRIALAWFLADANCLQGRAERFALATGESRHVTGLHGFRLCVSVERGTADPDCEPLE